MLSIAEAEVLLSLYVSERFDRGPCSQMLTSRSV
jgi:hypothetical protein